MLETEREQPFIQRKRNLIYGVVGIIVLLILTIRYPHSYSIWEWILRSLGVPTVIPIGSASSLILTGIPMLVLLFVSLWNLNVSISRHRGFTLFVAFMIIFWLPQQLVTLYQSTLATGIYALNMEERKADCQLVAGKEAWIGDCKVSIKNHSSDPVPVHITMIQEVYYSEWHSLQKIDLGELLVKPGHQQLQTQISVPYQTESERQINNDGDMHVGITFSEAILSDGSHQREFLDFR